MMFVVFSINKQDEKLLYLKLEPFVVYVVKADFTRTRDEQ